VIEEPETGHRREAAWLKRADELVNVTQQERIAFVANAFGSHRIASSRDQTSAALNPHDMAGARLDGGKRPAPAMRRDVQEGGALDGFAIRLDKGFVTSIAPVDVRTGPAGLLESRLLIEEPHRLSLPPAARFAPRAFLGVAAGA
jgi:hypothetical protein